MSDPLPLSYASPESEPKRNRIITIHLPGSVLLVLLQIPWFYVVGIVLGFSRMGKAKSLALDGCVCALVVAPAIAAITFSIRALRASARTKPKWTSLTVSLFAGGIASFFVLYMLWAWYRQVWLDPSGTWDSL